MGNVRTLTDKMEQVEILDRCQHVYRESSLMCFSETWLKDCIPDSITGISFLTIRADRDTKASCKQKGGGLAVLINNRWCNPGHASIKERICNKDTELFTVSLRPHYLPREITAVIAIVVHIPPSANAEAACDVVHAVIARLQANHTDSFIFLSGDFNRMSLSNTLPTFKQYIVCTTRGDKTLDLL